MKMPVSMQLVLVYDSLNPECSTRMMQYKMRLFMQVKITW